METLDIDNVIKSYIRVLALRILDKAIYLDK